jgi:phosphoglycolate phosphatase-like HAD superfamily hydrolase
VTSLLVLWDVDYTLAVTDSAGLQLYQRAFAEMFGGDRRLPQPASMAGRTDRAIVLEVLTLAGVPDPGRQVRAFEALLAAHAPELADLIRARGRALPGARQVLAALAAWSSANGAEGGRGDLVQSLLTGNIRAMAEVKLGVLGLTGHLDLSVGAYGDASEIRADLVQLARDRAARVYQRDFGGQATVLVGDTPLDVEAALRTGARAVGVATGRFSAAELTAAGAYAVLADLTDTGQAVAAILGPHYA